MAISADLLQAKQELSARLLQAPGSGLVLGRKFTHSVSVAVASAGNNVHAIGVGRKIVEGRETTVPAVRIYVVQKLATSLLSASDLLPVTIDGVPTDVIQSPPAFLTQANSYTCTDDRKKGQRPVVAGISTAHFQVTAGTLGYFCRSTRADDDPAQVYVLSNNHVFANVNRARIGDDLYQQGPLDGGTETERFARLHRFQDVALGGQDPNEIDAAIGALMPGVDFRLAVCRIGQIRGTAQAVEDMIVRKHGRTSGYTRGRVTDESYDALVGMDHNDPRVVALFANQMRIERIPPYAAFGLGGDSGSLVVSSPDTDAVGLYFAGPEDGSYGIANHIADVLSALEIELL